MIAEVIFYLLVIIGLFFFIIKILAQKNKSMLPGRAVRTMGGAPLGQNKSVQIVEIGRELYVLGVGENVTLISKIEDAEEAEYIKDQFGGANRAEFRGFQTVKDWLSGWKSTKAEDTDDEITSFQQVFQDKMMNLSNRKKKMEDLLQDDNDQDRLKKND